MFNKKLLKRIEELDIKTKDIEIEIFKLKNPNGVIQRKTIVLSPKDMYQPSKMDVYFSYYYYCEKKREILSEDFRINTHNNSFCSDMLQKIHYGPIDDLFIIEKTNDNIVKITCKLTNGEILVDTNMGMSFSVPKEWSLCREKEK